MMRPAPRSLHKLPVRADASRNMSPESRRMRCLLHIGTEKTGTTLLQDWLYANREALSARGIFLGDVLERNNNRKLAAYFQGYLDDYHRARGIADEAGRDAFFSGFEQDFAREVEAAKRNHHAMVISSEHFHSRVRDQERIASLRGFLDRHFDRVDVVCYFREQSEMLRSLYSTAMRVSHTASMAQFQKDTIGYYCDFHEIARRWSGAFGRERCDFRIYDRRAFVGGDIRRDFIALLPEVTDPDVLDYAIASSNESLSAVELSLYRLVNERVPYWNDDTGGIDLRNLRLKAAISACDALKVGRATNDCAAEIRELYRESNRRLSDEFFGGRPLFDVPPSASDDGATPVFSLDEVDAMLQALLGALIEATRAKPE
jgi:hypothetical protein